MCFGGCHGDGSFVVVAGYSMLLKENHATCRSNLSEKYKDVLKHSISQHGIWVSFGHLNPQKSVLSPFRTP